MAEQGRFVDTGSRSPAENRAIDEAILRLHAEGKVPPTVRFYTWDPPTLSIGYFQKAEREVDLAAVRAMGLGFVRRPTGGRAVLHDRELTYSIVVRESHPLIPPSVTEAYRVLSMGLLEGFRALGLRAEMVSLSDPEEKKKFAAPSSAACFDSPSWYELVVEGRKVAGSAQTRQLGVVLQHGSILLELDVDKLFSCLRFPSERVRARLREDFTRKAVAINDVAPRPVTLEEAKAAFFAGFAKGLGVELVPGALTPEEEALAAELVATRYGTEAWNLRR
ncbi:MAG: lipoate--protein ligase family protein [Calditerricola sp.]|nr:lipoate--protein ligase family protein [Calditerricola sp.]